MSRELLPPLITGDELRIRQTVLNRPTNALKFTPAGGTVPLEADIAANGAPESRVTDTGIGIAPEHTARLSAPFREANRNATESPDGSGLGLALTKRLTEMHGGTLTLESEPGKGTVAAAKIPPERVVAVEDQSGLRAGMAADPG